ncbi:MAG: tetratricopeptide repeat protein, partial [Xanthobacteraceae bacterium]
MNASNDGRVQPGSMSRRHLIFASLVVFPLIGPVAIALALSLPLAVIGLFVLGPGGLLYYFMLMTWWLPALYALLALPYFLSGVLVALAGIVFKRASLVIALIATELAFCAYLGVSYLAFGRVIPVGMRDYANMSPMFQSSGSVLVILAGAAVCWYVVRRIARPPAAPAARSERLVGFGVMLAGAVGLAATLGLGSQQPEIAWKDCTTGGWIEQRRGCTVIIQRGDREPVERRVIAYLRRGRAYEEGRARQTREDFIRAIADYTEAIRLDPSRAEAYASRGLAYAYLGQHDRTIADIDMALKLDVKLYPESGHRLFRARGRAHFRRGAFDLAIADHTREIKLAPRFADGYLHRA